MPLGRVRATFDVTAIKWLERPRLDEEVVDTAMEYLIPRRGY
jgi:hypothetical protein